MRITITMMPSAVMTRSRFIVGTSIDIRKAFTISSTCSDGGPFKLRRNDVDDHRLRAASLRQSWICTGGRRGRRGAGGIGAAART